MAFDPVDSMAISDTRNAFHGFDTDIAGVAKFDDLSVQTDSIQEVQDHKFQTTDPSIMDYAEAGAEKHSDTNILAQFFDGAGSIVNKYV
ncbi:MAG: hypothetical protein KKB70_08660 [Proteobacteria bacterium]|nr:hypothetical protein [Pseudomonadota bacterium]MBU1611792.1 hypothetical protein [Pseudomonadota bacterium]